MSLFPRLDFIDLFMMSDRIRSILFWSKGAKGHAPQEKEAFRGRMRRSGWSEDRIEGCLPKAKASLFVIRSKTQVGDIAPKVVPCNVAGNGNGIIEGKKNPTV